MEKTQNKRKILVICNLNGSKCNGQIAKTLDTINFLKQNGYDVSVYNYRQTNYFINYFRSIKAIKRHENFVLMPGGKRALFLYSKLLRKFNKKNCHYVAIGGWVLNLLLSNKYKKEFEVLKLFKGIYLQNKKSVEEFKNYGFKNVYYVSNFSSKKPISTEIFNKQLEKFDQNNSYNFCFFARVERTKGILLACGAIRDIQKDYPDKKILLDIYGQINDCQLKKELIKITNENQNIRLSGVLNDENAIETLSNYYCMIFPTFYKGEGTPHSIIESYMAGLPVIASNWAYNSELVTKDTGLLFDLGSNDLHQKIQWAIQNKSNVREMRINCFNISKQFDSNTLLSVLIKNLDA